MISIVKKSFKKSHLNTYFIKLETVIKQHAITAQDLCIYVEAFLLLKQYFQVWYIAAFFYIFLLQEDLLTLVNDVKFRHHLIVTIWL